MFDFLCTKCYIQKLLLNLVMKPYTYVFFQKCYLVFAFTFNSSIHCFSSCFMRQGLAVNHHTWLFHLFWVHLCIYSFLFGSTGTEPRTSLRPSTPVTASIQKAATGGIKFQHQPWQVKLARPCLKIKIKKG